jgi:hypothetical protein
VHIKEKLEGPLGLRAAHDVEVVEVVEVGERLRLKTGPRW